MDNSRGDIGKAKNEDDRNAVTRQHPRSLRNDFFIIKLKKGNLN